MTRLDNPSGRQEERVDDLVTIETQWEQEEIKCDEEAKCRQLLLPCDNKVGGDTSFWEREKGKGRRLSDVLEQS